MILFIHVLTSNIPPLKENITYDDFEKLDLRVAKVVSCEKVPKSKKLLKFVLDIGIEERTVLSGISQYYEPEAMVGKKVIYLSNLAPKKMMGIESYGMTVVLIMTAMRCYKPALMLA